MLNLININENGVAWVETDEGEVFGVVNAFEITDSEGVVLHGKSAMDVLEEHVKINQDWENGANLIGFTFENGESATLKIDIDGVELLDGNEEGF